MSEVEEDKIEGNDEERGGKQGDKNAVDKLPGGAEFHATFFQE